MKPCDENIMQVLELVEAMTALAELGDADSKDNSCSILYGIVRDSAHQIKKIAETEKEQHIKKGS
jgi:hypothetical protein